MLGTGSKIGGLRIEGLIGRGAMGEVFRATQLALKRPVAVKRIAEHLLSQPDVVSRFEREAQCLARVHSPHVVAVHDFGRMRAEDGSEHYLLVMELVEGGRSLRTLVGKPMDWRQASSLALQSARGLAAAAEFGVVHRDIKPDNIILSRRGIAKLADFGLARSVDSTDMTMHGTVLGTPAYMAPEACRGEAVDGRGDIYSLGATWYQLLAGRTPFLASNTVAMLRCHLDDPPPPLATLAPDVPPAIAALVHRCLAKDRAERPQSAQELIDALRALAADGLLLPDTVDVPASLTGDDAPPDPATAGTNVVTPASYRPTEADGPTQTTPVATASTAPTVLVGPDTEVTSPALTARKRRAPLIAGASIAIALAIAAGAWAFQTGAPARARAEVDAAIAAKDFTGAMRRTEDLLAKHPERPEGPAALRAVVAAIVRDDLERGRFDHARQIISGAREGRMWLDIDDLSRDVEISQAILAARDRRWDEAAKAFVELRHRRPTDMTVCRAILGSFVPPQDDREWDAYDKALRTLKSSPDLYYDAVVSLGEDAKEPMSADLVAALDHAQLRYPDTAEIAVRVRKVLIARSPASVAAMHQVIDGDNESDRDSAYTLLKEAGQLKPGEEARYRVRAIVQLGSGHTSMRDALDWLDKASAEPGWTEVSKAAHVPPVTAVECFESIDEWSARAGAALMKALPDACADGMAKLALDGKDESVRWNAYLALTSAGLAERADLVAFHIKNLSSMNPMSHQDFFNQSLEFLRAKLDGPRAKEIRDGLAAAQAHLESEADGYQRMGRPAKWVREMRSNAEAVRKAAEASATKDL